MSPRLFTGSFQPPALDEPGQDLYGVELQLRRQEGLGRKCSGRIADEDPPNGHRRPTRVIPDGCGGGNVDATGFLAIPRRHGDKLPWGSRGGYPMGERRQPYTLLAGQPVLLGLPRWSWRIVRGIQVHACDHT